MGSHKKGQFCCSFIGAYFFPCSSFSSFFSSKRPEIIHQITIINSDKVKLVRVISNNYYLFHLWPHTHLARTENMKLNKYPNKKLSSFLRVRRTKINRNRQHRSMPNCKSLCLSLDKHMTKSHLHIVTTNSLFSLQMNCVFRKT